VYIELHAFNCNVLFIFVLLYIMLLVMVNFVIFTARRYAKRSSLSVA